MTEEQEKVPGGGGPVLNMVRHFAGFLAAPLATTAGLLLPLVLIPVVPDTVSAPLYLSALAAVAGYWWWAAVLLGLPVHLVLVRKGRLGLRWYVGAFVIIGLILSGVGLMTGESLGGVLTALTLFVHGVQGALAGLAFWLVVVWRNPALARLRARREDS